MPEGRAKTLKLPFRSHGGTYAVVVMDSSMNAIVADVQWGDVQMVSPRDKDDSRMFIMGVLAVFGAMPGLMEQAINVNIFSNEEAEALKKFHLDLPTGKKREAM